MLLFEILRTMNSPRQRSELKKVYLLGLFLMLKECVKCHNNINPI
jgi:hypothetical protein